MRFSRACWGMVAGACLLLVASPDRTVLGQEGEPVSQANERMQQLRAELDKKLNQPVGASFNEVISRDAVMMIADEIEADVVFDQGAIDEEALTTDGTVTLDINHAQLSARKALEFILEPEGLAAVNDEGILMVTSANSAEEMLYIQVYDVRDLIDEAAKTVKIRPLPEYDCPDAKGDETSKGVTQEQASASITIPTTHQGLEAVGTPRCGLSTCVDLFGGPREAATTILIHSIRMTTSGPWFWIDGTGGTVQPFDGRLVVTQTDENHAQIQQILDGLRSGADADEAEREGTEEPAEFSEPTDEALPSE